MVSAVSLMANSAMTAPHLPVTGFHSQIETAGLAFGLELPEYEGSACIGGRKKKWTLPRLAPSRISRLGGEASRGAVTSGRQARKSGTAASRAPSRRRMGVRPFGGDFPLDGHVAWVSLREFTIRWPSLR